MNVLNIYHQINAVFGKETENESRHTHTHKPNAYQHYNARMNESNKSDEKYLTIEWQQRQQQQNIRKKSIYL